MEMVARSQAAAHAMPVVSSRGDRGSVHLESILSRRHRFLKVRIHRCKPRLTIDS
jgi:hypothetical protein